MEMHQLRYVVALARTGNFSRAAEQCHVSQPSLSQQVQKLEDELGERLFHRMKRATRLTPAGETFLVRARRILEEAEAARREAGEAHELLRGTINVGALPTIAPYLLPQAMALFAGRHPGVEMVVQEDTTGQLLKQLAACELDVAIASLPISDARFQTNELGREELLLALPSRHPLARKRSIGAADLEGERLIVMREGHCLGDQVLKFCERRETRPQVSFRSAQIETMQAMVQAGLGISLIPAMALHRARERSAEYRSLQSPRPERSIAALWLRERPPGRGATEFLKVVTEVLSGRKTAGRSARRKNA